MIRKQIKKKEDVAVKTEKSELEIVKEKVDGMEKMLGEFQVTNDDELNVVSDKIKNVKLLQKYIEQEKEKYVAPAKKIIAEARDQYDPYIKNCQNAEINLKEKAKKYMLEKEQKRLADEAKIAAKVESGKISTEKAIEKIEALPEVQKTVRTDNNSALRMSKRKVARIENPDGQIGYLLALFQEIPADLKSKVVPADYWIIDESRIKKEALAREKNGLPGIPGVIIEEETDLASL
jgi:vancomycin resistance protein YoaR